MAFALMRYFPEETAIPFIRLRFIAFAFSALLLAASVGVFFAKGLNLGIDFQGGVMVEVGTEGPADLGQIREIVGGLGLGDVQVQEFGAPDDVLIRLEAQPGEGLEAERAQQAAAEAVQDALLAEIPDLTIRDRVVLGPKVSGDLVRSGVMAVVFALVAMLCYIWFRFEWQFSLGAVLALTHDVIATIGMLAVTQIEFNLASIAAILTIVGYSMNDTVVVYDRIRETARKYKTTPLPEMLNFAINQTLSRTLITSLTTLMALAALFFLGGPVLRGFSFAMIWGIAIGTYSSIFIASPFLLFTGIKRGVTGDEAAATA